METQSTKQPEGGNYRIVEFNRAKCRYSHKAQKSIKLFNKHIFWYTLGYAIVSERYCEYLIERDKKRQKPKVKSIKYVS